MNGVENVFVQIVEKFTSLLNSHFICDILSLWRKIYSLLFSRHNKNQIIPCLKKNDLFGGVIIYVKNSYPSKLNFGGVFFMLSRKLPHLPTFHKGGIK